MFALAKRYALLVARLFLAAVFLYAGIVKASASAHFAVTLIPFTILPQEWIGHIAHLLPLAEILAGLLLLWSRTAPYGAALILLLCAGFITLLTWALSNDIIVACACFGQDETPSAEKMQMAIGRDVFLALVAAAILLEKILSLRRLKP